MITAENCQLRAAFTVRESNPKNCKTKRSPVKKAVLRNRHDNESIWYDMLGEFNVVNVCDCVEENDR
jgi:hypothetical protein